MTRATLIALSALELPVLQVESVPEWVHLLPKGPFAARDGRGPWSYKDAVRVIQASFAARPRIHIDFNHSTETAAKMGLEAPAIGYVTEMEERADGIWGRVDWTERGVAAMAGREYWGLSPVISFDKATGEDLHIARAALTNDPAVATLTPLSTKEADTMLASEVAKMLGLPEDTSEDDVMAALAAKLEAMSGDGKESLAALSPVAEALGVKGEYTVAQLATVAEVTKAAAEQASPQLVALHAKVEAMEAAEKKRAAEAFIERALAKKLAIPTDKREALVALHMENSGLAESMVAMLPILMGKDVPTS